MDGETLFDGLALPRFRGHLIIWEEGVHDVFQASALSA